MSYNSIIYNYLCRKKLNKNKSGKIRYIIFGG